MRAIRAFSLIVVAFLMGCQTGPVLMQVPLTYGSFVVKPEGDLFEHIDTLDPRNALVYVYRPESSWGNAEIQSPTFFVDDSQLFGLKSGAYEWLELHGGSYDFYARRPFSILFLKTVFKLPLTVEGGKIYYFRYSETKPIDYETFGEEGASLVQDGPLQQVPEWFAMGEITAAKLDEPGVYYSGGDYREPRWAPFFMYPRPDDPILEEKPAQPTERGFFSRWFGSIF